MAAEVPWGPGLAELPEKVSGRYKFLSGSGKADWRQQGGKEQETVWGRAPRNMRRHEGPGWSSEVKGTNQRDGWSCLPQDGSWRWGRGE